jgi:cytosine deaminase
VFADLAPGVRSAAGRVASAEAGASRVAELAEEAASSGTFGVGGLLVDRHGAIVAEAVNAVVEEGYVRDPTAHVERQLVDWYFRSRSTAPLPGPDELTIVCSLDPCAMCAGAILKSGFSVVAVAEDPMSGVHEGGRPVRLPEELQEAARERFALFAVRDSRPPSYHRLAEALIGDVAPATKVRCEIAFERSLVTVRPIVAGVAEEAESGRVTDADQRRLREASLTLPPGMSVAPDDFPLVATADRSRLTAFLAGDHSCLVDAAGRPICVAAGAEHESPARTSVLELIRGYVSMRNQLWRAGGLALPHPRFCSVVVRQAPGTAEDALLTLGALGSLLEERRLARQLPLLSFLEGDQQRFERYIASLPPLYKDEIEVTAGLLAPARAARPST